MNAKELILSKLNATSSLVDVYTYLLSLGVDTETIANIMVPGSFTYVAKLQEGDLFNNMLDKISIENAIRFYLGDYYFKNDVGALHTLFNARKKDDLKASLYDNAKVLKAIDDCIGAINTVKDKQKLMNAYIRDAQERGEDISEIMSNNYDNIEMQYDEYGNPIAPPRKITDLSVPEIYKMIAFLKECVNRNNNRKEFTNNTVDSNLRSILEKVLPGMKEQSTLGRLAGINQGLRTKSFDKIKFKQTIENYINGIIEQNLNSKDFKKQRPAIELLNDKLEIANTNGDSTTAEKITWILNRVSKNDLHFDFYKFITDPKEQKGWIAIMDYFKVSDNILEVITTVPHFKEMIHTWAVDETLLSQASARYNFEKSLLDNIKPNSTYTFKDGEYNQVKKFANDILILNWILGSKFTLNINDTVEVYDAVGNSKTEFVENFTIDSVLKIESFKHLVENYVVPTLKNHKNFKDNAFIRSLTLTSDYNKGTITSYLRLPVQMMDVSKSVEMEARYNTFLNAFTEISTAQFAGMKLGDLFYLYNLIVNKDSFGQKSMTRLFENLVNTDKGSFLVNDYNEWISNLDKSGDFMSLQMDLDDLRGRIKKYYPQSKIDGNLNGIITPDSTFEVPKLAKVPERINENLKEIITNIENEYSVTPLDVLRSSVYFNNSLETVMTTEDWDDILNGKNSDILQNLNDSEIKFLQKNGNYLREQKAFIHNGKIFVNSDNADISDLVHEWAHVILAQLKWSEDTNKRNKYYQIVAKIVDHPNFKDIADNYPWAHGSDLQEEVLVNLLQMYIRNKVFTNDNVLKSFKNDFANDDYTIEYAEVINFINDTFNTRINKNVSLENAKLIDVINLFGTDFYDTWKFGPDEYILQKHQKISELKNRMVKEGMLTVKCD